MSIIQGTGRGGARGFYDYPIEQSLRFDGSSYLSRTFGTPTDNNNYTFSCWFKLSKLGVDMQFFASRPTSTPYTLFYYKHTGIIEFADSSVTASYSWNHILRDLSSWYHLVLSVNATGTDRLKLYINNVLNTKSAGTDPNNNSTLLNSNGNGHTIGSAMPSTTNYFNGYLANIQFIDGQALSPSDFVESVNGIWTPKTYLGTYGTNGFWLRFDDSSQIGKDSSGRGNHWTAI